MKKKEFIGIDVSKKELDVHLWNNNEHQKFTNDQEGFARIVKWLKEKKLSVKSVAVCFEHTGYYSEALALYCQSKKIEFFMVSSVAVIYSCGIKRGKNDKIDSRRIAEYIARNYDKLKPTELAVTEVTELRKLLSSRNFIIKQQTALKNRLKNMEKESLIYQIEYKILSLIKIQLSQIENQIRTVINQDLQLSSMNKLIQSIKGVGEVCSWYMIATTNAFSYFENARKFASNCGVAPFENISGSSIRGKTQTDRRSNRKMNSILTMAANSAIQYNKELKEYYNRKREEGKAYACVLNAVKNKLIARIFAVVKRQTPYVDLKKFAA